LEGVGEDIGLYWGKRGKREGRKGGGEVWVGLVGRSTSIRFDLG